MHPPRSVLNRYQPALDGLRWHRAPGGFSGAEVWRGEDSRGTPLFALKAWPADHSASRLTEIHVWMKRAAQLAFIPSVLTTKDGKTHVHDADRVWDVTRWMPGEACESPSVTEIVAACAAVARLHAAWHIAAPPEPCPGVLNRLRILHDWLKQPTIPSPQQTIPSVLYALLEQAIEVVRVVGPQAHRVLEPWATVRLPVQPCVRDLRGEHVLFRDGEVTGIVDFGALARDYPGVDLSRLLGDLAGGEESRFTAGLAAYRSEGGKLVEPDSFIRLLEQTGAVCSVIGWLVRLCVEQVELPNPAAIHMRLSRLLDRIPRFRTH